MAKMFPAVIPEHLRNDRGRRAEIKVYDLLKQQLSDRFSCYWSRPWHRFRPEGGEQDGEVDFVIAHPDLGILSIEVKGGGVSRGANDQWQSRGAHDIVYNIKDPVEQARKSKYRLLELMKESRDWRQRFLTMRHAVILPDSARPNRSLGADAPLALVAFGNDLDGWIDLNGSGCAEGLVGAALTCGLLSCFLGVGSGAVLVGVLRYFLVHIGNYNFNVEMMNTMYVSLRHDKKQRKPDHYLRKEYRGFSFTNN